MSYTYDLTDRALSQLRSLESWLAEEVLDEIESMLPQRSFEGRRLSGGFVHDFVRNRGHDTVYVFLTLVPDAPHNVVHVVNIGIHVRPGYT